MTTEQKLLLRHLFFIPLPLNGFEVLVTQHTVLQRRGGNYSQLLQPTGGLTRF